MKTLMSITPTRHLCSQFPSPNVIFNYASLSRKNQDHFRFSHRRWFCYPRTLSFCSSAASESVSYGGWDDPRLRGALGQPGESTQLRNLLNSLGIDDKRYIFTYLMGFVCALAISRVRVSSIVLFPACAIVFAVGLSIGIVNGGHVNELTITGAKKRSKDESLSVSTEKLRNLLDLFAGIDSKIGNLKSDVCRRIENNHISTGHLESYVKVMESIGLSSLNARSVVEACINSISMETQELERNVNQKSGRRKKLDGENGFDLLQFIRGFFQESSVGSKPNKVKDCVKRDPTQVQVNDESGGNIFASAVGEKSLGPVSNGNIGKGYPTSYGYVYNEPTMAWDGIKGLANGYRRVNGFVQDDKMSFSHSESRGKRELDSEHYSHQTKRLWFMDNQQISLKMDHHNEVAKKASHSNLLESMDFSINLKHTETEASFEQEQILHKTSGSYKENSEREFYKPQTSGNRIFSEDNPSLADNLNGHKSDAGNSPSSMVSDDNMFNLYLVEAKSLLKEARECLKISCDEGRAETLLFNSAKLLSRAIDMKPMSLLAVGQLGNTYLLHGELKLKISRQLRALLTNRGRMSVNRRGKIYKEQDYEDASKDEIGSALVNVCEECEELLVEAGRRYRLALSIDGNDMRALYNWGLALSFRAQLIADIGPEAAFDADKVFLAAIDKFDAIMSKSNDYTPDALFRWGVALQQRSRLRPRNSKEKVKLLQQAKRLYEDALDMDSNNLQVKEALSSCISELGFRRYY